LLPVVALIHIFAPFLSAGVEKNVDIMPADFTHGDPKGVRLLAEFRRKERRGEP